jgi:hypothetical protein
MIQDIEFVFASVASGEWTKEEFETWCVRSRTVIDDVYDDAYAEGYDDGYDTATGLFVEE